MKFYFITPQRAIIDTVEAPTRPISDGTVEGNWITFETTPPPAYNPAAQVLVPVQELTATELRTSFTVRAKTQFELALEAKHADRAGAKAGAKADTFVQTFIAMTPAAVAAYVEANVTTLAEAKALMKKLALMLLFVAKENFED